ncbi:glycosyl hydrolase [Flaviaesturariibacter amylovorans]
MILASYALPAFAQTSDEPCDTTSRYLYWTGEENNDFFNEKNWRITHEHPSGGPGRPTCFPGSPLLYQICTVAPDPARDRYPRPNTLNPGAPIRLNLFIDSGSVVANGEVLFACAQKGITLNGARLEVTGGTVSSGVLSLMDESTVHLRQGAMSPSLTLNFLDAASWVYFHQDNPRTLQPLVGNIRVNHGTGTQDSSFRINDYYSTGAVVRPISPSFAAATIFSGAGTQGTPAALSEELIYSGTGIPNGMDNATRSFILKRGYMATLAVNANGTSKSRVYIASEQDLTVNTLDVALAGNVSFIRVLPWNWSTKKGTGGRINNLNAGWLYNWNNNSTSTPNFEYVPMAWGASGAFPGSIRNMIAKKKSTHLLGFNESDNCNDQSGQYNNLCEPSVAVAYFENLMGTGLRLGSPAPREEGPTGWLKEFNRIAKEKDVRFDFVAVHWYDWGSNPQSNVNATPQQIFIRFKSYLQNVYNQYKLPIWITEFNANDYRPNATQEGFLALALPYLESLPYVERYAYFQPLSDNADYFVNGVITNIGQVYAQASSPSMPNATYVCPNNLDGLDQPYTAPVLNTKAFEAECGQYIGNQWKVLSINAASNELYLRGDNSQAGVTPLARRVHYEFELTEAGTYRVYLRSSSVGTGTVRIGMDGKTMELITPLSSSTFIWHQIPRYYDLGPGLHRLTIEFPNTNFQLDQVAISNGSENLDALKQDSGYCQPSSVTYGIDSTKHAGFYEAEVAAYGSSWSGGTSPNAGGGAYLSSQGSGQQPPAGTNEVISFSVSVPTTAEYDIWAKIQARGNGESSLWISVDDQPFRKWNRLGNPGFEWYWKKFYFSYGSEDRALTYFLAAGTHTVKIAMGSGIVAVDRIAVATTGVLPETTDPNVLVLNDQLEFEAETATFLGSVTAVNCVNSSNGQQVNLFTAASNGVRFDRIVASNAGTYVLRVSYMSKDSRSFKVVVNGATLTRQIATSSGNWCYVDAGNPTRGFPGVYEVVVNLNRGLNNIDIKPWGATISGSLPNAPFIDKIKLVKAPLANVNLEAEHNELVGGSTIVGCAAASNLGLVNLGASSANGVRYKNLVSEEERTYDVDISYIARFARNLRVSVNGGPFVVHPLAPSGNLCAEGGTPAVKTIPLTLVQGTNTIELRTSGADGIYLDKIVIKEQAPVTTQPAPAAAALARSVVETKPAGTEAEAVVVYPNPATAGSPCTIVLNGLSRNPGAVLVHLTDMNGRTLLTQRFSEGNRVELRLTSGLGKGLYLVNIQQGQERTIRKVIIQ